jgi:dienelactone hydrolase
MVIHGRCSATLGNDPQ